MFQRIALATTLALGAGAALAGEVVETTTPDGHAVQANLEEVAEPTGPMILITHGTLAHGGMDTIAGFQQVLAERGLPSLAPNLSLGLDNRTGMYDCATPHTHKHSDAPGEIGAWVDWLQKRGVEEIVVMGHSRGGNQTAWYLVEDAPPAVTGAVLVAPMTYDHAAEAADWEERTLEPLDETLARAEQAEDMMGPMPFIYCDSAMVAPAAFIDYYGPDPRKDTPTLLTRTERPVLVIAGSADTVVEGLPDKIAAVDDPQTDLVVIEGADHFFRDLFAEDVADAVTAWLAARDQAQ